MRVVKHLARITLVAILLCASFVVVSPDASAGAMARDFGAEAAFVANLNAQRAARGLAPLSIHSSMSASAASWTRAMVNGNFLAHSNNLLGGVPGNWSKVGENVGRGRTVASLTSAFMASSTHARNVLDASYTHIGVAVYVHTNGRVYTTHRFAALPVTTRSVAQLNAVEAATQIVRPAETRTIVTTPTKPVAAPAVPASPPRNAQAEQQAEQQAARMRLMTEIFGTN